MSSVIATVPQPTISTWDIDPSHSGVHFSVRHLMISNIRGEFEKVTGSIALDLVDIARSQVRASIDASSIMTRDPQRDAHLKSQDFLDVARYPAIEFQSTRVARTGEETLDVGGDLTIHGVTRPVVLKVELGNTELTDPFGNVKRAATATTRINRKDFGLEWNVALETGGFLVGDELKIEIDLQFIRLPDVA